ncbi:MAG: hypothetical protein IJG85_02490 [Eubacteriaceae bacterium]|nr:hypothetical protein [Eubacteriaceae bacterium]MBR0384056.1 hypothetical protein [Eubacteriaceae bacterium]
MKNILLFIRETIKTSPSNDAGFVLPTVLIILSISLGIAALTLSQSALNVKKDADYLHYEHCLIAGESAIEICKSNLESDCEYKGTNGIVKLSDNSTYEIKVARVSDNLRQITITAQVRNFKKTFSGTAEIDPMTRKPKNFNFLLEY